MLLSLRATPVVCKAWIIDKAVCVYVGWGGGLCIRMDTANTVKDCTWHGRCVQSLYVTRQADVQK